MDLISIKESCTHFQGVVSDILKQYKYFNFEVVPCGEDGLTMSIARKILVELGPNIERLSLPRNRFAKIGVNILKLIPGYCLHLTELEILYFPMNAKTLKSLQEVLKSLNILKLIDCNIGDSIEETLIAANHLSNLDLSYNNQMTGKCLRAIRNIQSLNLEGCTEIQEQSFCTFLSNNRALKHLNIKYCYRLAGTSMESIAQNMSELTSLVCSYQPRANFALIAKLTKLRRISLHILEWSIDSLLIELSGCNSIECIELEDDVLFGVDYALIQKMTNLKELYLNYKMDFGDEQLAILSQKDNFRQLHIVGCIHITENQLVEFIGRNPLLETLDISYCQVTDKLLFAVIEMLEKKKLMQAMCPPSR
ncbi:F-box/LRR-repeat protein 14-like [Toxorhynchites rutilus septentrionalis]|uniref:F-box/LRR-repeat protein 14-like n=1 Tax=Toxorhynchites rutilus septentrionalis TaxID=329112 RepID=UPI002478C590|nr:F-box/LRR-repeat protein 14-like [Toxorhynchites rutilus septentrionalis]